MAGSTPCLDGHVRHTSPAAELAIRRLAYFMKARFGAVRTSLMTADGRLTKHFMSMNANPSVTCNASSQVMKRKKWHQPQ